MLDSLGNLSFSGAYLMSRYVQFSRMKGCGLSGRSGFVAVAILVLLDFLLGYYVSQKVNAHFSPNKIIQEVLGALDHVVFYLRELLTWLMGAPAGLKLNSVFSNALGKFFLYHVHLWVTFIYLVAPFVSQVLSETLTILSYCGFCLQLSLAQDTFNLITFHIHCFYAYARRLFLCQTSGIVSLWRLFRGKKWNPLRNRVDTYDSTVQQKFVGTLFLTILIFLYPTTLVYFAVFKVLELGLFAVNWSVSTAVSLVTHCGKQPDSGAATAIF